MDIKDVAFVIEDLTLKAETAKSLLLAICDALTYGPNDYKNYLYAIEGVFGLLAELSAGLEEQTKALFGILKSERGVA